MKQYTLSELNTMSPETFAAVLSGIFEHSPWVAEIAATLRPFDSIDALHREMSRVVETQSLTRQLGLINAHPELAGKAAVRGELTDESTREQKGAGLDRCTQEELDDLQRLNAAYREKFGFPYVLAVRGYDLSGIVENLKARLDNSRGEELHANLDQISRIARFRLDDLIDA
jgi:2-oxo-4-hydroxy-4-carboxy-5-ureidoimidazoline decarboxylase